VDEEESLIDLFSAGFFLAVGVILVEFGFVSVAFPAALLRGVKAVIPAQDARLWVVGA
jgi:hypothetical protein